MHWNVNVTLRQGPVLRNELLAALPRYGRFRSTPFRDVCVGEVHDGEALLRGVDAALAEGRPCAGRIGRVIPVVTVLPFEPATLEALLKEAVAPLVERMTDGSFCVRLERRGLAGKVPSADLERAVAGHVYALAAARNLHLRTDFADPDFIIAAETLGAECGLGLITRALRERYPFVQTR
jgi:tRNA(Ser,Leu) C12 N-acetylase TAN1